MFQGLGHQTDDLNRNWGFDPASIDFLILSHAHIDHSGLISKLVKDGFSGTIFCTSATLELTHILLQDSAEIQQNESRNGNRVNIRARKTDCYPLIGFCCSVQEQFRQHC